MICHLLFVIRRCFRRSTFHCSVAGIESASFVGRRFTGTCVSRRGTCAGTLRVRVHVRATNSVPYTYESIMDRLLSADPCIYNARSVYLFFFCFSLSVASNMGRDFSCSYI